MQTQHLTIQVPYLEIFGEENWSKYIPKKYLINSHTFHFDHQDTEFFIDDCTNPDYSKLKIKAEIDQVIKEKLSGQAFLKIQGRTAKDIQSTMTKILNVQDLTMAIKMSQFLTQALDDELEQQKKQKQKDDSKEIKLNFTLRQYKNYFESPMRQFRLYLLNDNLLAMCQKVPNFISSEITEEQVAKAQEIAKVVFQGITKILTKQNINSENAHKVEVVVDCFILQTGAKAKIFSIQPIYPLHSLSLFASEELKEVYQKASLSLDSKISIKPLLKYVQNHDQFKEVDLSYYRVGWELGQKQALQQWKEFLKGK